MVSQTVIDHVNKKAKLFSFLKFQFPIYNNSVSAKISIFNASEFHMLPY